MDGRTRYLLLGLLLGALGTGLAYELFFPGRAALVDQWQEERSDPAAPLEAFEPRAVEGITPPAQIVRAAREEVADVLVEAAALQQDSLDRNGRYLTIDSLNSISGPSHVTLLSAITQPTAFCLEAAHGEVPGTQLRFISVSGEIDAGVCDPTRPLDEQVGSDRSARSGGKMDVSRVRLAVHPPSPGHHRLGNRHVLLFEGRWQGPGLPVEQLCDYRLLDSGGRVVHTGSWAFDTSDMRAQYEGPTFFGKTDLAGVEAVDAELECRNRW